MIVCKTDGNMHIPKRKTKKNGGSYHEEEHHQDRGKALLEIAKRLMAAVDSRGDLEEHGCDSEDFIEVPVWAIQKAMEEAYLLGKENAKPRQPDTAPHRGLCHGWQNDPNEPKSHRLGKMWRRRCAGEDLMEQDAED